MPTFASFKDFVGELQGRAKDRPFSLQFLASCGTGDKAAKRLLRVSYRPDLATEARTGTQEAPPSSGSTTEASQTTIYELYQEHINDLEEILAQPDTTAEPAADVIFAAFDDDELVDLPARRPRGEPRGRRIRIIDDGDDLDL